MRSDSNLNKRFAEEGVDTRQYGSMPGVLDTSKKVDGQAVLRSHSFSGNESNSVFLNHGGKDFEDISGVSGLDSLADGRAFAFFDFDRDGRNDIILTNTNNPQLQLFHNGIPDAGNSMKVRLVGGSRDPGPTDGWSSRDGYGAHVLVEVGDRKIRRELRCGDGFAAQNSDTLMIGLGKESQADKVTILWPSGKRSEIGTVPAGSLATVFENPKHGEVAITTPSSTPVPIVRLESPSQDRLDLPVKKELNVVVTMTTWCPVCRGEIPHLRRLSEKVGEGVGFYGVPIDPKDDSEKFATFEKEAEPPYEIFTSLTGRQREDVENLMTKTFGEHPLPCTFIVDGEGRVLKSMRGTPTLSQLRQLLIR